MDVDETIINFFYNHDNPDKGVLKIRTGLTNFLEDVEKYYELIIFSESSQDYSDLLIDTIENGNIYFEQKLFKQHFITIDRKIVKDLNRI